MSQTDQKHKIHKDKAQTNPISKHKTAKVKRGFFAKFVSKTIGEEKEIAKYLQIVDKVAVFHKEIAKLSDAELRNKTQEFRSEFKNLSGKAIQKKLLEILPEAFAVVQEASVRTIGLKHFSVQLVGAMVLNDGRIAEMKTGEGKTLVSTLAVYLNSLPPESQVHVVTVNDYLARRDASWMGQIYDFLGLTVGVIQPNSSFCFKLGYQSDHKSEIKRELGQVDTLDDGEQQDARSVLDVKHLIPCSRQRAYWDEEKNEPVDIVYGVNSEFGFDYLRDNMAQTPAEINQKAGHCVAMVDEVDSILIDEARTPLIISAQDENSSEKYKTFARLVNNLNPNLDYTVDEKRKTVTLSDLGIEKVERNLGIENIYDEAHNVVLIHHLDQALKAKALFKREKEYVILNGEIVIVDEFTGRMMIGRRFNQGLHQAIEAKENVTIQPESKTTATVTFQNYFRLYKKLAGMTGTAATESEELFKIYKLLVVTIPTNRDLLRIDSVDKIFKTEDGKFKAIVRDIKEISQTGQPILIGTTSIDKNLRLSQMLTDAGVKHQVLNAKNHEQEALIVSKAGEKGAITLATNIAGRGVDIKLGGEPPESDDQSEKDEWKIKHEEVKKLGGLFVIGTERHESRRIDNQLRGRAGRQGDPGRSQFYISLEDYILRVFGGEKIAYYNRVLPVADDEPIQFGTLSWLIEQAQKKIESQNFDIRKHVTEYDDVINRQRNVIYSRRKKVLTGDGFHWKSELDNSLEREFDRIFENLKEINKLKSLKNKKEFDQKIDSISLDLRNILDIEDFTSPVLAQMLVDSSYNLKKLEIETLDKIQKQLTNKWQTFDNKQKSGMTRFVFLRAIDILWTEHLVTIDYAQDAVRLRGYSQKDPLAEFKQDGMDIFIGLLKEIDKEVAVTIFKVKPELVPSGIMEGEVEKSQDM